MTKHRDGCRAAAKRRLEFPNDPTMEEICNPAIDAQRRQIAVWSVQVQMSLVRTEAFTANSLDSENERLVKI